MFSVERKNGSVFAFSELREQHLCTIPVLARMPFYTDNLVFVTTTSQENLTNQLHRDESLLPRIASISIGDKWTSR